MTITWYGHSCFKIANQGGHLTIITDPFSKEIGLTPPRGNADIVTVSCDHQGHNNVASISGDSFIVDSAGEYEIKGVTIIGLLSSSDKDKAKAKSTNIIYLIEMDQIRICHLGDIDQSLSDSQLEKIGAVDILMIPVGGQNTIDASKAQAVVEQIEPAIIIPMHYKLKNLTVKLDAVDKFLKEMGLGQKKPVDRLTLRKKDLTNKEMEVVVMQN